MTLLREQKGIPVSVIVLLGGMLMYVGADIRSLCAEIAMGPVRDLTLMCNSKIALQNMSAHAIPPVNRHHVLAALDSVSSSVSVEDLKRYIDWNQQFGTYKKLEM